VTEARILWRRLISPGHEGAWLSTNDSGEVLTGTAVFAHEGEPCSLSYQVICDRAWRTRSARVEGRVGSRRVSSVQIDADPSGRWRLHGEEQPQVDGCDDIDLNFSPSTNLLPIRRLGLEVGSEAPVRAAWLRFPAFVLEPLEQSYRRTGDRSYRYASAGGSFTAELEVDESGFVTRYPGGWEAVPTG
jgi:uncharacterized protein